MAKGFLKDHAAENLRTKEKGAFRRAMKEKHDA
jgi:hypothetical protein